MEKENLKNEQLNQCHPEHSEGSCKILRDRFLRMTAETGRSMVEMLGVLAIIGLLTIIGIAGFRYAMNKHYANQTVERLMRRAVVVAGQANFGQNLSLHEFDAEDGEYPITLLDRTDNESFTMQADNVPQEVCQQIVGLDWKLAKIIPADCSDTSMKFKFLNELTDCSTCVAESVDCPPESEMQCGTCSVVRGFLDNNDDCENNENGTNCVRGKCTPCANGYHGTACASCSASEHGTWPGQTPESGKYNCLGKMIYNVGNHYMYGCEVNIDRITSAEEISCKACPNRCFDAADNSACRLFNGKPFGRNADGSCSGCPKDYYGSIGGGYYCASCSSTAHTTGPGQTPESGKHNCLKTMIYNFGNHYMYGCEVNIENITSAEEVSCKACPNRCFVKNSSNSSCQVYGEGYTYTGKDDDGYCTNTAPN